MSSWQEKSYDHATDQIVQNPNVPYTHVPCAGLSYSCSPGAREGGKMKDPTDKVAAWHEYLLIKFWK